MACEEVEHVVEERDRGADLRLPLAVEIEGEADLGFFGYSFDRGLTGHDILLKITFKVQSSRFKVQG
jgi:hypothetical protein